MRAAVPSTVRSLLRHRSFTFPAAGILAVGIASVTAMWTVANQVLLRPLPVRDQHGIVVAWARETVQNVEHFPWTAEMFEAAERGGIPAFADVAAVGSWGTGEVLVEDGDGPSTLRWTRTLGDFFGVLGVEAEAGRLYGAGDDVPAPPERVAVISDGLWASRWGRSAEALGEAIRTRSGTFTVIGVTPAGFAYPSGAQMWVPERPFHPEWDTQVPHLELDFVARLAPGATMAQAAQQLSALPPTPELARVYANADPVLRPLLQVVLGDLPSTLLVLLLGSVLVLLVAALDVANLVLLRAVGRRPEVAVRRAVGADSRHLLQDGMAEAVWLGGAAAVAGSALSWGGVRLLIPFVPAALPRLREVHGLDPSALILAVGAGAFSVLLAVLLPLWRAEKTDPVEALRGTGRGTESGGALTARGLLVTGQVALTVWVMAVGILMTRSVLSLRGLDLGFRADGLAVVALDYAEASLQGHPGWLDELQAAMEEMRRAPGILGVTPLQMPPLPGNAAWQSVAFREGETREEGNERNSFMLWEFVEPDVFEVLGVAVLRGRGLLETDDESSAPVVVVNETAARIYWPGEDALGQRVWVPWAGGPERLWTVVGVVADTRYGDLTELRPAIYYPLRQTRSFHSNYLVVRTAGPGTPVLRIARDALRARAPAFRPKSAVSVRSQLDTPLAGPRFTALLLGVFSGIALLLAAAGMYGVMASWVRSRRVEIGIRLACGSTPGLVARRVMLRGVFLATAGAALGAASGVATGVILGALLFGVSPADPMSLALSMGVAVLVALLASGIPARQAAGVDPMASLRGQ